MRIYALVGIAFIVLCLALVGAMIVDSRMQPQNASDVVSSIDAGPRD